MESDAPAERMLAKLRAFIARELAGDERAMLAALLAPGIARAYIATEVEAFGLVDWLPDTLPRALSEALQEGGIDVRGFDQ